LIPTFSPQGDGNLNVVSALRIFTPC